MSNFKIEFTVSPWLLLLLIPALAIIIALFFIGKKKPRRTLNRIVSTLLQSIVLLLSICVLSGMYFTYDKDNMQNELVILVDNSFTTQNSNKQINDFIHEVLIANNGISQISIVTFGYDQKVILKMGDHEPEDAYASYCIYAEQSPPEDSATDIAAALQFVWDPNTKTSDIISYPETAKILLISDGLQTDQDALNIVKRLAMDGISVDTTFFSEGAINDASIVSVKFPERNLMVGETFNVEVTLKSSYQGTVNIIFEDENENGIVNNHTRSNLVLNVGTQKFTMSHSFDIPGYHELRFRIQTDDTLVDNNIYYAYYDLGGYNRVLILEKYRGESNDLVSLIRSRPDNDFLFVNTAQIGDRSSVPANLDMMALYNEIILYNIARGDMTDEFELNLYSYVYDLGGGLFTVGGFEKDITGALQTVEVGNQKVPKPHSYMQDDMQESIYESMLPVIVEPYTPPLGVAFIIDTSGSMMQQIDSNGCLLDAAIEGALACLDAFDPRDYVGVISLEEDYRTEMNMTPMTQREKIENAIIHVAETGTGGGTDYSTAIEQAGRTLGALDVARKHIIFISDAAPSDEYVEYSRIMGDLYNRQGITITVVTIAVKSDIDKGAIDYGKMEDLAKVGGGSDVFIHRDEMQTLPDYVKADLKFDELKGINMMDYNPTIGAHTAVVDGINEQLLTEITLKGFFTSRAKNYGNVQVALMAKYVPLYAEWNFGNGKVGSLMMDLEGVFSRQMLTKDTGVTIISNIVSELMMQVETQEQTLEITLVEDNYRTQVNIYGYNSEEETDAKLVAFVSPPKSANSIVAKFDLSELSYRGNRFVFENLDPGIYTVIIIKVNSSFDFSSDKIKAMSDIPSSEIIEIVQAYRAFSYSKEYDLTLDPFTTGQKLMADLSTREMTGESIYSKLVYDPEDVFGDYSLVHIVSNPRLAFMITAIILYLIDIALRKFKLRLPKEIRQASRFKKSAKS